MSNPVHTSATMMCGDSANKPSTAWKAVHSEKVMCKSQSGTAFQAVKDSEHYIRGHPLLRRVCTSVTHSVAFQAILNLQLDDG